MKKFLLLGCILAIQSVYAQIISKDLSFASNGIHSISTTNNTNAWSRMLQNSDGSIYFTYNRNNGSTVGLEKSFLSKLNVNGIVDTSFGNNGELELPYFTVDSQIKRQSDGKLVILSSSNSGPAILRILPSGQFDSTFGVNGISSAISDLGVDGNGGSHGIILQNEKIIIYGIDISNDPLKNRIFRLNSTGSIDTTFGNNGSVITQGSWSNSTSAFVDSQLNIVCVHLNGIIQKFNPEGQPLTSFGNNGVLQTAPYNYLKAIIDSNNNIIFTDNVGITKRIKPDGTIDNTFNFNPTTVLPFPIWILSIVEKNGSYYIGGAKEVNNDIKFFISKLNQNGVIDSNFNYFVETNPSLNYINDMIINDNNIIANGNGYIVKYLLNNSTLSTVDTAKNNFELSFENPVKQNLMYQSKEKINKIEIYSVDGKLVKTVQENNSNVAELSKGVYFAKVAFENGQISTKKLIKN